MSAAAASSSPSLVAIDQVRAAALAGKFDGVAALLVEHPDLCSTPNAVELLSKIEQPTSDRTTCMHVVADRNYDARRQDRATLMMLFLSDLKLDIIALRDASDETPLHRAARSGFDDLVEILVKADDSALTAGDIYRDTPLHTAILQGYLSTVKLLIRLAGETGRREELLSSRNQNGHLLHFVLDYGVKSFQCIFECLTKEEQERFCAIKNIHNRTVLQSALAKGYHGIASIMTSSGIQEDLPGPDASSSSKRSRAASSSPDRSTKSRND